MTTFFQALRSTLYGERITKQEWGDGEYWGQVLDGQLVLHKPDGVYYPWIISEADMRGMDWMIMEHVRA